MDYIPTNWQTGDVITAEKLNNIEQGIYNYQNLALGGNDKYYNTVVVKFYDVEVDGSIECRCSKTYDEIVELNNKGSNLIFIDESSISSMTPDDEDWSQHYSKLSLNYGINSIYDFNRGKGGERFIGIQFFSSKLCTLYQLCLLTDNVVILNGNIDCIWDTGIQLESLSR